MGAEAELTGLRRIWRGEVGTALWVDHGGTVAKTLSALELPLLHTGTTGYAAL